MILLRLCCALKMARVTVCSSVPGLKIRVRMEYQYQVAHNESDGGQLVRTNNSLLAKNNSSYFGRPGTHVSSSAVVTGSPTLLTLLTLLLPIREEREERTELAPALPAVFLYFLFYYFFAASWWWSRDMRVAATRAMLITMMSLTIMDLNGKGSVSFPDKLILTNLLSENLLRWPESSQLEKPPSQYRFCCFVYREWWRQR